MVFYMYNELLMNISKAMIQVVESALDIYSMSNVERNGQVFHSKKYKGKDVFLDYSTDTDISIEEHIKASLGNLFPTYKFYGEELYPFNFNDSTGTFFLLDPVDGTSNLVSNRKYCAISLCYFYKGTNYIGIIADFFNRKIVLGIRGMGAFSHDRLPNESATLTPLRISNGSTLENTQIDLELTFKEKSDLYILENLVPYCFGIRKQGSTALDILNISLGLNSALIANDLKSFDFAAGVVIARETGLAVSDWEGNEVDLNTREILVCQKQNQKKLLRIINEAIS